MKIDSTLNLFMYCMCWRSMPQHKCESQRLTVIASVASSILWVTRLQFRSSGVVARASTRWTNSQGLVLGLNENRKICGL